MFSTSNCVIVITDPQQSEFWKKLANVIVPECCKQHSVVLVACKNIHLSSLFAAGDISHGGRSVTQRQKFHTDDTNQCLFNNSHSHGVPNVNLFNFRFLLVDFGKLFCSSANELKQNSNACSREDCIFHKYCLFCQRFTAFIFHLCGILSFVCHS